MDGGSLVCSGRILFQSDRDGNAELYLHDPDIGDTNLTQSAEAEFGAQWSPDGLHIGFSRQLSAMNVELFLLTLGVDTGVNVSDSLGNDFFAGWHPSGDRLLFSSDRDGNEEVYTIAPDGSGLQNLSNSPASDQAISFSPDGTLVLFSSDRDGPRELWVMAADGGAKRNLGVISNDPVWSPDSTLIAYSNTGIDVDVFVLDVASAVGSPILVTSDEEVAPDWSPDQTTLAFEGGNFIAADIFTISPSGGTPSNLTPGSAGPDRKPRWSPDGSLIAFETQRTGATEIFTMKQDGSEPVRRTQNDVGVDRDARWQPCTIR